MDRTVNILAAVGAHGEPSRFGVSKRELTRRWPSWLNVLATTEDGNEGTLGTPPPTGLFVRIRDIVVRNPSLTIAALAERAASGIARRASSYGVTVRADVPVPAAS